SPQAHLRVRPRAGPPAPTPSRRRTFQSAPPQAAPDLSYADRSGSSLGWPRAVRGPASAMTVRSVRQRWGSTPLEPVEVVGPRRGQLDGLAPEVPAQQIELDLCARRDVLVVRQHDDPAGRHVPFELLHKIGYIDVRFARHDVVDHYARAAEQI